MLGQLFLGLMAAGVLAVGSAADPFQTQTQTGPLVIRYGVGLRVAF